MPRDDCGGEGAARQPCCRRRGGGGGALVEPAALAALLYAGGYGYDMRKAILERTNGEVDVDVGGLYRSLRRLEDEGAVASRWCDEDVGPRRREYELTQQGVAGRRLGGAETKRRLKYYPDMNERRARWARR